MPVSLLLDGNDLPAFGKGWENPPEIDLDRRQPPVEQHERPAGAVDLVIHVETVHGSVAARRPFGGRPHRPSPSPQLIGFRLSPGIRRGGPSFGSSLLPSFQDKGRPSAAASATRTAGSRRPMRSFGEVGRIADRGTELPDQALAPEPNRYRTSYCAPSSLLAKRPGASTS